MLLVEIQALERLVHPGVCRFDPHPRDHFNGA